ncbi:MAG: uracil phosphoribosyltransferase, partial [Planctomycetota bacterium]
MSLVEHVRHPLIEHHLCKIRETSTKPSDFRLAVQRLSMILGVAATHDLATRPKVVQTPICETT